MSHRLCPKLLSIIWLNSTSQITWLHIVTKIINISKTTRRRLWESSTAHTSRKNFLASWMEISQPSLLRGGWCLGMQPRKPTPLPRSRETANRSVFTMAKCQTWRSAGRLPTWHSEGSRRTHSYWTTLFINLRWTSLSTLSTGVARELLKATSLQRVHKIRLHSIRVSEWTLWSSNIKTIKILQYSWWVTLARRILSMKATERTQPGLKRPKQASTSTSRSQYQTLNNIVATVPSSGSAEPQTNIWQTLNTHLMLTPCTDLSLTSSKWGSKQLGPFIKWTRTSH